MRTWIGLGLLSIAIGALASVASCGGDANVNDLLQPPGSGGATDAGGDVVADATGNDASTGGAGGAGAAGGAGGAGGTGGVVWNCEPTGEPCGDCMGANCCDQVLACQQDDNCMCFAECMAQNGGDILACGGTCGFPSQTTQQLGQCMNASCNEPCLGGTGGAGGAGGAAGGGQGGGGAGGAGGGNNQMDGGQSDSSMGDGGPIPCDECIAQYCQTQSDACQADPDCQCWVDCFANGGSWMQCNQQCGQAPATFYDFAQCFQQNCQGCQ